MFCLRIWPVHVLPSTVTQTFPSHGERYWFGANNTEFGIFPYHSPEKPMLIFEV